MEVRSEHGSIKFFRSQVAGLPLAAIKELASHFDDDCKRLKEDVLKMCWYSRGSISFAEGMMMCSEDRQLVGKIIKENLDTTKKTGLPFF